MYSIMSNRVYNFVSRVNREKFIRNKKSYTISVAKNMYNRILIRKIHTYNMPPPENENKKLWLMFITASSVYILDHFYNKKL